MTLGLSVTSFLLLGAGLLRGALGRDLATPRERTGVAVAALVSGLALYPMALGVGPFDPYALGFPGRDALLVALLLAAILAVVLRQWLLLAAILASVLFFSLELGMSSNLWDYWVDPWLVLYAGFRCAVTRGFTIV